MPRFGSGIPLTPQQFVAQWANAPHKLAVNIYNFEVNAGKEAVAVFKQSFSLGRFNSNGESAWRARSPRSKATHPILNETGTLKRSIKWKRDRNSVVIYTDPNAFGTAARHKGFCYAAVHNDPSGTHTYGKTGVKSKRRQFMGESTVLWDKLKRMSVTIFKGFPI